jgi:hypothetical protein
MEAKTVAKLLVEEVIVIVRFGTSYGSGGYSSKAMRSIGNPVSTICIGALFFLFGGFFCEQNEQPATYNLTCFRRCVDYCKYRKLGLLPTILSQMGWSSGIISQHHIIRSDSRCFMLCGSISHCNVREVFIPIVLMFIDKCGQHRKYCSIMERIAMDILCELPVTSGGNKHILVISDYYTKWTECFAMPNMEAKTVTKLLEQPATYNFTSFCKLGQ